MELGDLNTLMLKDDDYNYRHNKKLLMFVFNLYKNEYFSNYEDFKDIFFLNKKSKEVFDEDKEICDNDQNNYNENNENNQNSDIFPLINFRSIKFSVKIIFLKILFKEISLGLKYLHSLGICHRDIKPENIVYSSKDECCKIIDFSISTFKENENNYNTKEPGGSIYFQAPEQYEIGSHNPFISDIWSLGVTIYIFLFEVYPFDSKGENDNSFSELELQMKICNENIEYFFDEEIENYDHHYNEKIKDLIDSLLIKDFRKRLTIDELIFKLEKL